MKKVLIITKIGKNYGAVLQAYALKNVFEEALCDVSVVHYVLPETERTYMLLPKVYGRTSLIKWFKSLSRISKTKQSVERFFTFRKENFNFTKEYHNFEELNNDSPDADIYVTGSDQVWNPKISFDKAYYLMFGSLNAIRVSYAASIGLNKIPNEYKKEFFERIHNVNYISVREESAKRILADKGINSTVHIDPTLLLEKEKYDEIAKIPDINEEYILLYFLIVPEDFQLYIDEIRRQYPNHKIVSILGSTSAPKMGDMECADIGPCEFLGLIKNADAVLTTSFHGTVFSIIYKKQFMSVLPVYTGSRISSLLCRINLDNRVATNVIDVSKMREPISYDKVNQSLSMLKSEARDYVSMIVSLANER